MENKSNNFLFFIGKKKSPKWVIKKDTHFEYLKQFLVWWSMGDSNPRPHQCE